MEISKRKRKVTKSKESELKNAEYQPAKKQAKKKDPVAKPCEPSKDKGKRKENGQKRAQSLTHSSVHAEREMLDSLQILSANFPSDSTNNIQLIESDDENENLQVTNDRLPLPQPTVTTKPKQNLTNKLQPLTNRLQQPFTAKMKQLPQFSNPENQLLPIRQQSPLARIEKQPFTDRERLSSVVTDKNGLDKRWQLTFASTDQHPLTANIQQLPLAKNNNKQPLRVTQRTPSTDGGQHVPTERQPLIPTNGRQLQHKYPETYRSIPTVEQSDVYYDDTMFDAFSDYDDMQEDIGLNATRKVFVDAINTVNDCTAGELDEANFQCSDVNCQRRVRNLEDENTKLRAEIRKLMDDAQMSMPSPNIPGKIYK